MQFEAVDLLADLFKPAAHLFLRNKPKYVKYLSSPWCSETNLKKKVMLLLHIYSNSSKYGAVSSSPGLLSLFEENGRQKVV